MENKLSIKTKLKFEKSKKTGLWVGFVSINPENGYMRGVKEAAILPKKIVIVRRHSEIESCIQPGVLYDVKLTPMRNKKGYVVEYAEPHMFQATVESCVVPNAVYWVKAVFGNKTIIFNPLDGKNANMKTLSGCLEVLSSRKDVKDLPMVIAEFQKAANLVLLNFKNDGYYVKQD